MNVCIIPARGGSKRIIKKNIKKFCGKPIIYYPINTAKKSNIFDKIIVSTDDEEISSVAKYYGAEVPFKRPSKISGDFATTIQVVKHAIEFIKKTEEINYVCCLYPTAVFVNNNDLIDAKELLEKKFSSSILLTAKRYEHPLRRSFSINKNGKSESLFNDSLNSRTQDLEDFYHDAGQFYFAKSFKWLKIDNLINDSIPFILPYWRVYDIDTLEDWKRAELIFEILKKDKN